MYRIFAAPLACLAPTHSLRHSVKKMNLKHHGLKAEVGAPAQHFITHEEVFKAGLEPSIPSLAGKRLIHWATRVAALILRSARRHRRIQTQNPSLVAARRRQSWCNVVSMHLHASFEWSAAFHRLQKIKARRQAPQNFSEHHAFARIILRS